MNAAIQRALDARGRFLPRRLSNPLTAAFVALSIAISPVYVFPQGYPQPVTLAIGARNHARGIKDPASIAGLVRKPEIGLIARSSTTRSW